MVNRIVDAAREILNKCVSDIYIYTDHCKGSQAGRYDVTFLCLSLFSTRAKTKRVLISYPELRFLYSGYEVLCISIGNKYFAIFVTDLQGLACLSWLNQPKVFY
jgi:hypothetical protein